MTVNSTGDHGEPVVTDPPATIADFAAHAAYTRLMGNRIVGTASQRGSFSTTYGFAPFNGVEFYETDTGNRYIYANNGWAGTSTDGAIVSFQASDFSSDGGGYSAQTSVSFRNTTRFTAIPAVAFGTFTGASQSQHPGVVNLTTSGFTLYYWRANQTATSIGWTAIPTQL